MSVDIQENCFVVPIAGGYFPASNAVIPMGGGETLNRFQLRLAMASVGLGCWIGSFALADAYSALDPNAFASLGSLSGATSYVFNTAYGSAPTLTENGATVITGVILNGFAVFDFSDINISTGSTITTSGQLRAAPLAICRRDR